MHLLELSYFLNPWHYIGPGFAKKVTICKHLYRFLKDCACNHVLHNTVFLNWSLSMWKQWVNSKLISAYALLGYLCFEWVVLNNNFDFFMILTCRYFQKAGNYMVQPPQKLLTNFLLNWLWVYVLVTGDIW